RLLRVCLDGDVDTHLIGHGHQVLVHPELAAADGADRVEPGGRYLHHRVLLQAVHGDVEAGLAGDTVDGQVAGDLQTALARGLHLRAAETGGRVPGGVEHVVLLEVLVHGRHAGADAGNGHGDFD